jgi:hypothetical protein
MKMFRITNGFDKMNDAFLLIRANFIKDSLAGNSHYPTPLPTLTDLSSTIASFQAAVLNAQSGNRQEVSVKNEIRTTLIMQLHLLGNYVLFTAGGNEVIATSSGFRISKQPEPRPAIINPQGLALVNGLNKGELELSCGGVAGARSYLHEITPAPLTPSSKWETITSTLTKNLFANLESGKEYVCRIAAVGVKKQLVYSDIVSRIAL